MFSNLTIFRYTFLNFQAYYVLLLAEAWIIVLFKIWAAVLTLGFVGNWSWIFSTVRDDDSDYCDGQIPDDSQINSPTSSRRSPVHEPFNNENNVDDAPLCMSMFVLVDLMFSLYDFLSFQNTYSKPGNVQMNAFFSTWYFKNYLKFQIRIMIR